MSSKILQLSFCFLPYSELVERQCQQKPEHQSVQDSALCVFDQEPLR